MKAFGRTITREELKQRSENRKLMPTRDDFKGRPGYWEKPGKVYRAGVGMVDGFEWGCRAPKVKTKRRQISALELGDAIAPFSRAEDARQSALQAEMPKVALRSRNGTEYVEEHQAEATMRRNGWKERPGRGRLVAYIDAAGRYVSVGD